MRAALNGALTRILPRQTNKSGGKTGGNIFGGTPPGVVNRQHLESLPFRQNFYESYREVALVLSESYFST